MKKTSAQISKILLQIVDSSLLAPSSHNTQPWLFAVENESLFFFVDKSRALQVADPTNRELYVSIGCSIANALAEAHAQHLEVDIKLFPDKKNDLFVAELQFSSETQTGDFAALQPYIKKRLSNRFEYKKDKKIPASFIAKAEKIADLFGVEFKLTTEPNSKKELAKLTQQAIFTAISNAAFRDELMDWIRHNWTKKTDGMPGYGSGLPNVLSLLFPALLHSQTMPKMISDSEYKMVINSTGVVVLSTRSDHQIEWVKAGIALELIWLTATQDSLVMSLLSGAVEYEKERKKVKKLLQTDFFPSVFFRIGYPTTLAKASPRRTRDDVLRSKKTLY